MNPTNITAGQFEAVPITAIDALDESTRTEVVATYQRAFAAPPYNEAFTADEAETALQFIFEQDGDVLLGKLGGKVVSLAGGYPKPDGTYYIEELAVTPDAQGNGYGRSTLRLLLSTSQAMAAKQLEIRTTVRNDKARRLYESEGFVVQPGTEVVAQRRRSGSIELDERVYLSRPPLPEQARLATLKRAAVAYPSGNTTAVVFDQLLDGDRKALNDRIMRAWKDTNPQRSEIEQCCFVTLPVNPEAIARVEMFGGEFCGNATRSVAWILTGGQDGSGLIEVSGVDRPLAFEVADSVVAVEMPLPSSDELTTDVTEGTLVQLDGIAQLVVTDPSKQETEEPRQLLVRLLQANEYGLADQPAVGVSYYDQLSGKAAFCVWVKAVDTIFDETACGSGTSAIGIAAATSSQDAAELPVVQPSGEVITTKAQYKAGRVTQSTIAGTVNILYDGEMRLP